MRQRITHTLLAASILMHPSIVHARYYSEWYEAPRNYESLILLFIFWGLPTYLLGFWAGEKWGIKGTPFFPIAENMMKLIETGEKLYKRLMGWAPKDVTHIWKGPAPAPYSLTSYLHDILAAALFTVRVLWRISVFAVFWPLGMIAGSVLGIFGVGGFLVFGGFDIGAEKGRAKWEQENAEKEKAGSN